MIGACISAKTATVGTASAFKLPSQCKTCTPPPPPQANYFNMPIRSIVLVFSLCVLYYCSQCTLTFPPR